MGLVLTVKYGQWFTVGDARLAVKKDQGMQCRVVIEAPRTTKIVRGEFDPTLASRDGRKLANPNKKARSDETS